MGLDGETSEVIMVGELTSRIKDILEQGLGFVSVRGEISGFRPAASGHVYFNLKDSEAVLNAVLFRNSLSRLRNVRLKDGLEVVCKGRISVYAPRGSYQMVVETLEPVGAGGLQAQFEELKKKLQAEGLFALERKRPIPRMPGKIAVITSPTGAAIRDVVSVITRRHAGVGIVVIPSLVQGQGAEAELIDAIQKANDPRLGADVVLLTRGGGSLEDLWCFNSEALARAIIASRLPVVSAVGHEVDFSIADFVADLRAATPSAAAELLVRERDELRQQVDEFRRRLAQSLKSKLDGARLILQAVTSKLKNPRDRLQDLSQRFDEWADRLTQAMRALVLRHQKEDIRGRLVELQKNIIRMHRQELSRLVDGLKNLSPSAVLDRGYSLVFDAEGKVLRKVEAAPVGSAIRVRLAKGELIAEVRSDWPT
jgi:exodeoxyribonuclease VII large subunit